MAAIMFNTRYASHRMATGGNIEMKNTPADIDYLQKNPDVAEAVNNGDFVSGYDYYLQYGKAEYEGGATQRFYDLSLNNVTQKAGAGRWLIIGLIVIGAFLLYKKMAGKKGKS